MHMSVTRRSFKQLNADACVMRMETCTAVKPCESSVESSAQPCMGPMHVPYVVVDVPALHCAQEQERVRWGSVMHLHEACLEKGTLTSDSISHGKKKRESIYLHHWVEDHQEGCEALQHNLGQAAGRQRRWWK